MITLLIVATTSQVSAQSLDCDWYGGTNPLKHQDHITDSEFTIAARCPDGRSLIEPKCLIERDFDNFVTAERLSFRSARCTFRPQGNEGTQPMIDALGEPVLNDDGTPAMEGNGEFTYDYDVRIEGLCCK